MSIRTLIEINHDYLHRIEEDAQRFAELLSYTLGSGTRDAVDELERYGVVKFGSRHHSGVFGPTTIAAIGKREWSERTDERNEMAAAEALVRGCLVEVFGQQLTEDQIHDVAMKVRRVMRKSLPKLDVAQNAARDAREAVADQDDGNLGKATREER